MVERLSQALRLDESMHPTVVNPAELERNAKSKKSFNLVGGSPYYQTVEVMPPRRYRMKYEGLHEPLVCFEPMRARASTAGSTRDAFDAQHICEYIRSLRNPRSPLGEFEYILKLPDWQGNRASDPLLALFRATYDDTNSLVEIIRTSLQTIRKGTLDENLMLKPVMFWQGLMHQLNFSLGVSESDSRESEQFATDSRMLRAGSRCHGIARDTRQALRGFVSLIDRSPQSLLAEMQIAHIRRGIVETESVSKLTGFAFVFIPLSICASLFSMQIHELEGGVPAYTFILVLSALWS